MFGDLNEVREENERFGSHFLVGEAQVFNDFIHDSGLVEMSMGGRRFTWMNKAGSKMSKLDRFILSDSVIGNVPDLKATVLDRLWSYHNPILLHSNKTDYGPIPFKFFHSWIQRQGFEEMLNQAYQECVQQHIDTLHDKLKYLKQKIKEWTRDMRNMDRHRKQEIVNLLHDIDIKIDSGVATETEREDRVKLIQEVDDLDSVGICS
ncbi:RNA-directed DNA polymerase, eukaryota, reverse transcriptase zinc-binding domain protein [Tanacetum coccineum]